MVECRAPRRDVYENLYFSTHFLFCLLFFFRLIPMFSYTADGKLTKLTRASVLGAPPCDSEL